MPRGKPKNKITDQSNQSNQSIQFNQSIQTDNFQTVENPSQSGNGKKKNMRGRPKNLNGNL